MSSIEHSNNASEFYADCQILLRICQAIGAAPITINYPEPIKISVTGGGADSTTKVKRSIAQFSHKIWSLSIFLAILVAMYSQRSQFDEAGSISNIAKNLYLIEYVANIFIVSTIMIGCNLNANRYGDSFRDIQKIDDKLNIYSGGVSEQKSQQMYVRRLVVVVAAVLLAAAAIDTMYNCSYGIVAVVRSEFVYVIPNFIQFMALAEYVCLLRALRDRYYRLGVGLKNAQKATGILMVSRIIELAREIHQDLCAIELKVNEMFGVLIVAVVASSFIICGIQLYALYEFARKMINETMSVNWYLVIYTLTWLSMHAIKCVYLLVLNSYVSKQVSEARL